MINNPNQLDKFVMSMTEDQDTIVYFRSDQTDNISKAFIHGTYDNLFDMLYTLIKSNPYFKNLIRDVLITIDIDEAQNN